MLESRTFRVVLLGLLAGWSAAHATESPASTDRAPYTGVAEIYLERNDPQQDCSVTVTLRNLSGARQGEARLRLAWLDRRGRQFGEQWLRMDPTEVGQLDAKNLNLGASCDRIGQLKIGPARWQLGWDIRSTTIVPIAGVDGTQWSFRWDERLGLFVARPVGA